MADRQEKSGSSCTLFGVEEGKPLELKLGRSFDRDAQVAFHSVRYDFKPASVDTSKMSVLDIEKNNSVTVTVPHVEGSGKANTVYKGNRGPCQKECALIIDHETGQITIEKLANNIRLKKTRLEGSSKIHQAARPHTPTEKVKEAKSVASARKSTGRSSSVVATAKTASQRHSAPQAQHPPQSGSFLHSITQSEMPSAAPLNQDVELMSDSSSSSSSDDGGSSDSDSACDATVPPRQTSTVSSVHQSTRPGSQHQMPSLLPQGMLQYDLHLSESSSDSD